MMHVALAFFFVYVACVYRNPRLNNASGEFATVYYPVRASVSTEARKIRLVRYMPLQQTAQYKNAFLLEMVDCFCHVSFMTIYSIYFFCIS